MKKVFLSIFLSCSVFGFVNAQESVGGIPWSMSQKSAFVNNQLPVLKLQTPDFEKAKKEDEYNESIGKPGKYRVALGVKTDVNLSSGNFTYLEDGSVVWRMQITVPSALALKLQYEKFDLPAGVTYYVQNGKKNQLIGGFDNSSVANSESMAHDMVQGDIVNLEMDIKPGVDIDRIQLHINQVYALYRGANEVNNVFEDASVTAVYGEGESNSCEVNAKCDQGKNWFTYANAVAHIWIVDGIQGGFCSGTLISNTKKDCTPLFLTASHCDGNNAYSNSNFSQWEFTFNYWRPICGGGGTLNTSKVLKGADFQSRSYLTIPAGQESGPLYGDFLLLKLKDPASKLKNWNVYMAGWDRSENITDSLWIDFHHPKGDVMKFTKFSSIDSLGEFNTDSAGTHWEVHQAIGGVEPGSSGSGLWTGTTGMLIGDLSGGVTISNPCQVGHASQFSKISHNWTNQHDVIYYNDSITANNSQLHNFLDPISSGAMTVEMAKIGSTCTDTTFRYPNSTPIGAVKVLDNGVSVYPNPSSGMVNMIINLSDKSDLTVDVTNVLGQKMASYRIKNVGATKEANFDLSNLSEGIYLMRISNGDAFITRKIILKK